MTSPTDLNGRYGDVFTSYYRILALVLLLATVIVGAGVIWIGGIEMAEFALDSETTEAEGYIEEHFSTADAPTTLIVVEGSNTLERDSLLETMDLQEEIRKNETIAPTLDDDQPTAGVENAMAIAWDPTAGLSEEGMSLAFKRTRIAEFSDNERNAYLSRSLHLDDLLPDEVPKSSTALPRNFERGDTEADARLVVVVHERDATREELVEAQLAIEALAEEHVDDETFVFAEDLTLDRGAQVTGENFGLIGPLAVVLVGGTLFVVYRNPLDVLFATFGTGVVLLWVAGFLGWTGIGFNQLLIAVPCLLIGLSVDHALHVVMRYREARVEIPEHVPAMAAGLGGVGVAIGVTTFTTVVGFLSSLSSPIGLLREFGVVAAFGIVAALLVFGGLIPALKLEADRFLVSWGYGGRRRPVGRLSAVGRPLGGVAATVRAAPTAIVVIAVLLAMGGIIGITGVETESQRADFLPAGQPAWMGELPNDLQPADYPLQEQAVFVDETFAVEGQSEVEILIRGDVTDPETLASVSESEAIAEAEMPVASHSDNVYAPTDELLELSFVHDRVNDVYEGDETDGKAENLEALYDAAFDADPEAASRVIHRSENGDYVAMRMVIDIDAEATIEGPAEFDAVVTPFDSHPDLEATVTGSPIVEVAHDRAVVSTVFGTFVLALAIVVGVLVFVYRLSDGSWLLGGVVAAPIVMALSWVVLTMRALAVPFTPEVAIIAGVGIGLGVDYTVHIAERYRQERRNVDTGTALERTIVDTGGTLAASAITTALGFGVLLLTVVPSLQRFGLVTVLVVTYSFVACVLVLPSLLYLWDTRENSWSENRA